MEQKSERVQKLITQILSNIISYDNSYLIVTPSFILNYFVLNATNLFSKLNQMESFIKLPSFCNLSIGKNDCDNSFITLKVKKN